MADDLYKFPIFGFDDLRKHIWIIIFDIMYFNTSKFS